MTLMDKVKGAMGGHKHESEHADATSSHPAGTTTTSSTGDKFGHSTLGGEDGKASRDAYSGGHVSDFIPGKTGPTSGSEAKGYPFNTKDTPEDRARQERHGNIAGDLTDNTGTAGTTGTSGYDTTRTTGTTGYDTTSTSGSTMPTASTGYSDTTRESGSMMTEGTSGYDTTSSTLGSTGSIGRTEVLSSNVDHQMFHPAAKDGSGYSAEHMAEHPHHHREETMGSSTMGSSNTGYSTGDNTGYSTGSQGVSNGGTEYPPSGVPGSASGMGGEYTDGSTSRSAGNTGSGVTGSGSGEYSSSDTTTAGTTVADDGLRRTG